MTEEQFFNELKEIHEENPFEIQSPGYIRQKETNYCPLIAVAKNHGFKSASILINSWYDRAGRTIGLDRDFVNEIVYAADGDMEEHYKGTEFGNKVVTLRSKLEAMLKEE